MRFLISLAVLFVACGAETVWTEFPEKERLYAAVSGDSFLPPEEFSAVLEGASPRLTWSARKDAVGYRIYRAVSGSDEWQPLQTEPLSETEWVDGEISVLTHSGIWRYTVTAVDEAGKESFQSEEAAVVVSAPDFEETVKPVEASAGGFVSAAYEDTAAVRVVFRPAANAVSYTILRKEAGKGTTVLAEKAELSESVDENGKLLLFYDTAAVPGVVYEYRIVPVNAIGQYGRESEAVEGFIFPAPRVSDWDITAQKVEFRVFVPEIFRSRVNALEIRFYDSDDGREVTIETAFPFGFSDRIVLSESQILRVLNEKISRRLSVEAAVVFDVDGTRLCSAACDAGEVLFFSKDSTLLAVPTSVTIEHGVREFDGTVTAAVVLRWQKPSDTRIQGYRIYRSEFLDFANGVDSTDWGEPIADIKTSDFADVIDWGDSSFSRFGAFYYKINPYADENTETENNRSVGSFACAAVFPPEGWPISASMREFEEKVRLRWNKADGIDFYNFYAFYGSAGGMIKHEMKEAVPAENGESYFDFDRIRPGEILFRFSPIVVFETVGGEQIETVSGNPSAFAVGSVELSDIEWTRLVMKTIADAQRTILPADRKSNAQTKTETVSFFRRRYLNVHKYDLYGFRGFSDEYESVRISGTLAHIYCEGFNFSYSVDRGMPMTEVQLDRIDDEIKSVDCLTVSGTYPGKIYVWAANGGKEVNDSAHGVFPTAEFPQPLTHSKANEFASDYGFDLSYPTVEGWSGHAMYTILRDDSDVCTFVTRQEVGSVELF